MSNVRFDKLDKKVEEIDTKVDTLTVNGVRMETKFEYLTESIKKHVEGDEKIITEIQPLMQHLPAIAEMAKDHAVRKEVEKQKEEGREKRIKLLKYIGAPLVFVTVVITFIFTIGDFFKLFS